ncbi:hypothetical protein AV530_003274 [Patagioenas fasciata monilis]|uniref:Uncharacterized protein n=1 Tax=Patagioenas fasciata monilis TaxID=372326 RepID=A0A1V4K1U1_PATFA|nr:hypothetical protein AV530_003274 [Patagioenas fasciata monilis]
MKLSKSDLEFVYAFKGQRIGESSPRREVHTDHDRQVKRAPCIFILMITYPSELVLETAGPLSAPLPPQSAPAPHCRLSPPQRPHCRLSPPQRPTVGASQPSHRSMGRNFKMGLKEDRWSDVFILQDLTCWSPGEP